MSSCRTVIALALAVSLAGLLPADSKKKKKPDPDEGMILEVDNNPKKKKGDEEVTQTLPPPKEAPQAVAAETDRLFFQVSPLSNKGLLSQQTRDAMRVLLRSSHGSGIVKMRAFVAGSGDMRRIHDIAGEVFGEKKLNLPALSVVQAGALPMEGAQVVIESIGVDKKPVNPNGVAFLSGQAGPSVEKSIEKLRAALQGGGMEPSDMLRVTCFVSSLEGSASGRAALDAAFPGAAINVVQMQRLPVNPASECEAVARLRSTGDAIKLLNPPGLDASPNYSQMALVRAPKVIFSGTQMAFGGQEPDVQLAFERLQKALATLNTGLDHVAMSHIYLANSQMAEKVRAVRKMFYSAKNPPASTLLPFEGLPSLDATFGLDVVAVVE